MRIKFIAITGEEWGRFLSDLFDAWYPEDTTTVSIRNFDAVLSKKIFRSVSICTTGDNCSYFVVEHNGNIFPCDFFVTPDFQIGNIMENTWEHMQNSPVYKAFGRQKSDLNPQCKRCPDLELCADDCLKNRMALGNPPSSPSVLCSGIKHFLHHTRERFDALGANFC